MKLKRKGKINISEQAVITPKRPKTVDISKYVICHAKTKEAIVEVPGNIEKILPCIKEIQHQTNTLIENELNNFVSQIMLLWNHH